MMKLPFSTHTDKLFNFNESVLLRRPRQTWVVGNINSPTIDFYFNQRTSTNQDFNIIDEHAISQNHHSFWSSQHDCVVLVRNVPITILQKLMSCQNRHIIWFIDDDIPGIGNDLSLPRPYRKKMQNWYKKAKPYLSKLCSGVWVSTNAMAKRYDLPVSSVLPPLQLSANPAPIIKCFYHATSTHQLEWAFVIKLVREIQQIHAHTHFEFIGDHKLYKACKGIPRVTVLHPMKWNTYKNFIATRDMDIGLCPLINSPFNLVRSHTKFLDITRQGAIGIFSPLYPYAESIRKSEAGFIANESMDNWLAAFDKALNADRNTILLRAKNVISCLENQELIS